MWIGPRLAKNAHAEAFVSIHFNAAPADGPPAQGTETWIGTGHNSASRALADLVQREVLGITGYRDRGVKVGNVSGVIKPGNHDPQTASCLVEISFLDRQPDEERRLRDPSYIGSLGAAILEPSSRICARGARFRAAAPQVGAAARREPEDAASARQMGLISRIRVCRADQPVGRGLRWPAQR